MCSFNWKKKRRRLYQRWNNNNHCSHQNIFRTKGGKRKTAKVIPGCYGYHETYRWNLLRGVGEGLCSRVNQRVMQQKFSGL